MSACRNFVLEIIVGEQVLSFSELSTVMYEVANLINERPIGKHPAHPDDGTYLSPNELILGRASSRAPAGPFKTSNEIKHRFEFIQSIVNSFWKKWIRDFFPTLLIRNKWHTERRNVKVGDVVLVKDSNIIRGNWLLGKIKQAIPSRDGRVRKCKVLYHCPSKENDKSCKVFERPVHNLVVLIAIEDQ